MDPLSLDTEPLTSWTRTLNEDDAWRLLDVARPGLALDDWATLGHDLLPQSSQARRQELVRIVRDELLDHDGAAIVDSTYLRLFQGSSPHRKKGLLFGRLLGRRPLVGRALETLIHPALTRLGRPLPPPDADLVDPEAWDSFLRAALKPGTPAEAFKKTRTTLQAALRDAGVLTLTAERPRITRAQHGRPDPLAFGWVLAHEMYTRGLGEAPETWALTTAFAARLFAPRPDYAAACLDGAVREGLLTRGHLMGHTRLHLGETFLGGR